MNTPWASLPNVALKPVVVFHRIVRRCPRQSAPSMNCPWPTAASSSATPVTTSTPSWAAPLPPPLALTSPHKVAVAYFCAKFHFSVGNFHWGISHDSFLGVTVMSPGIPVLSISRISANFCQGSKQCECAFPGFFHCKQVCRVWLQFEAAVCADSSGPFRMVAHIQFKDPTHTFQ